LRAPVKIFHRYYCKSFALRGLHAGSQCVVVVVGGDDEEWDEEQDDDEQEDDEAKAQKNVITKRPEVLGKSQSMHTPPTSHPKI
jgi:hypothetical protein